MSGINYSEKIPNNVNLSEDRTLQRALEQLDLNVGLGLAATAAKTGQNSVP